MPQDITLSCQKNDIKRPVDSIFVEAEKFSDIPFDSISEGRRASLFLNHYPQSMEGDFILLDEKDEVF